MDADPELALAGQAQEPAPVAQLLGGHAGIGDERFHRRHRGRPHLFRLGSSVHTPETTVEAGQGTGALGGRGERTLPTWIEAGLGSPLGGARSSR